MKLSIAWIFDHIDADWKQQDIQALIAELGSKTAEIEAYHALSSSDKHKQSLAMVEIVAIESDHIVGYAAEWQRNVELPLREHEHLGGFYLAVTHAAGARWATASDLIAQSANAIHAEKSSSEKTLPPFHYEASFKDGSWKKILDSHYIIEVDNKSITHRPDLWSHRGFAREISTILELPLKPLEQFLLAKKAIETVDTHTICVDDFTIRNEAPQAVKRFSALEISSITYTPSLIGMSYRLALVGSRAINAIVDATNYVMLDLGQPMHAFDAAMLAQKTLCPRMAHDKEKLALLDGESITLTPHDLVITDGQKPVALAGIMGGLNSAVSEQTTSIILEAATFDPAILRTSAQRHKKRTESSARFEKSLDPYQTINAIRRFLHLLQDAQIPMQEASAILSIGHQEKPIIIACTHAFIEQKLGVSLDSAVITCILTALGFAATCNECVYTITVPSWRATKDVTIKEDIVEEIGRIIGYNTLAPQLPYRQTAPVDTRAIVRIRTIKHYCAHALAMQEIYGYALHDENFLHTIGWEPRDAISIKNPISEHWRRLTTTLVPNLIQAVSSNIADHDLMRFFEWGRAWHVDSTTKKSIEQRSLSGIFFDKKQSVDFYAVKALLTQLFDELRLTVTWQQVAAPAHEWYAPYQTAALYHEQTLIGYAGMANAHYMIKHLESGSAFIFELDGDFLLQYAPSLTKYMPTSKYPGVTRDISMLVPLGSTVDHLSALIAQVDPAIQAVQLVDFFENHAWAGQRSLTMRIAIQKQDKTLTKEEIDTIMTRVTQTVEKAGATIR